MCPVKAGDRDLSSLFPAVSMLNIAVAIFPGDFFIAQRDRRQMILVSDLLILCLFKRLRAMKACAGELSRMAVRRDAQGMHKTKHFNAASRLYTSTEPLISAPPSTLSYK